MRNRANKANSELQRMSKGDELAAEEVEEVPVTVAPEAGVPALSVPTTSIAGEGSRETEVEDELKDEESADKKEEKLEEPSSGESEGPGEIEESEVTTDTEEPEESAKTKELDVTEDTAKPTDKVDEEPVNGRPVNNGPVDEEQKNEHQADKKPPADPAATHPPEDSGNTQHFTNTPTVQQSDEYSPDLALCQSRPDLCESCVLDMKEFFRSCMARGGATEVVDQQEELSTEDA
jgi:hypothetical protein